MHKLSGLSFRRGLLKPRTRLVLITALLSALAVPVETARSEQGAGQKARVPNLPPEVLRMTPRSGSAGVREAQPDSPPMRAPPTRASTLEGLVLSGKLVPVQSAKPIVLTPRKPYHSASQSWFGCRNCLYAPADSSASVPGWASGNYIEFTFNNLTPQAMYVVEIEMTFSNYAYVVLNPDNPSPNMTLSLQFDNSPALFAFNAPSKEAHFKVKPGTSELSVKSVKLLQVKQ